MLYITPPSNRRGPGYFVGQASSLPVFGASCPKILEGAGNRTPTRGWKPPEPAGGDACPTAPGIWRWWRLTSAIKLHYTLTPPSDRRRSGPTNRSYGRSISGGALSERGLSNVSQ